MEPTEQFDRDLQSLVEKELIKKVGEDGYALSADVPAGSLRMISPED